MELRTAAEAIIHIDVPTTLLIDCAFVVDGIRKLLDRLDGEGLSHLSHQDLWNLVKDNYEGLQNRTWLEVRKVEGHTALDDVYNCIATLNGKVMDDGSDVMAKEGSTSHRVPPWVRRATRRRTTVAAAVQGMEVNIIAKRPAHFDELVRRLPIAGHGREREEPPEKYRKRMGDEGARVNEQQPAWLAAVRATGSGDLAL